LPPLRLALSIPPHPAFSVLLLFQMVSGSMSFLLPFRARLGGVVFWFFLGVLFIFGRQLCECFFHPSLSSFNPVPPSVPIKPPVPQLFVLPLCFLATLQMGFDSAGMAPIFPSLPGRPPPLSAHTLCSALPFINVFISFFSSMWPLYLSVFLVGTFYQTILLALLRVRLVQAIAPRLFHRAFRRFLCLLLFLWRPFQVLYRWAGCCGAP